MVGPSHSIVLRRSQHYVVAQDVTFQQELLLNLETLPPQNHRNNGLAEQLVPSNLLSCEEYK
eukprot:3170142-Amphidinium_carterae.1